MKNSFLTCFALILVSTILVERASAQQPIDVLVAMAPGAFLEDAPFIANGLQNDMNFALGNSGLGSLDVRARAYLLVAGLPASDPADGSTAYVSDLRTATPACLRNQGYRVYPLIQTRLALIMDRRLRGVLLGRGGLPLFTRSTLSGS